VSDRAYSPLRCHSAAKAPGAAISANIGPLRARLFAWPRSRLKATSRSRYGPAGAPKVDCNFDCNGGELKWTSAVTAELKTPSRRGDSNSRPAVYEIAWRNSGHLDSPIAAGGHRRGGPLVLTGAVVGLLASWRKEP
jgi:hypothetical protein